MRQRIKILSGVGAMLILPSCASFTTIVVPDTSFGSGGAVQAAISTYYRNHAVEYDVPAPAIVPISTPSPKSTLLKRMPNYLVINVRYAFRDRLRDDEDYQSHSPVLASRVLGVREPTVHSVEKRRRFPNRRHDWTQARRFGQRRCHFAR